MLVDLQSGTDEQMKAVAEIIQLIRPEVILINEFDYIEGGAGITAFQDNYLGVSQNGADPITFDHSVLPMTNTGYPSGFDFDDDGVVDGDGDDAWGYGDFPGQYGFIILSQYPIDEDNVRTFQKFKWKDMPGALRPEGKYTDEEWDAFRLSSKNHVDVPVIVNGHTVHILASHPTPPVFDDGTDEDGVPGGSGDPVDWNGFRNHDEIRFWADYIAGESYFYDDLGGSGGLAQDSRFIIMGDLNADTPDGDSTADAIDNLMRSDHIYTSYVPESAGGLENNAQPKDVERNKFDTADWGLRADYVLPSATGLGVRQGGVFWPVEASDKYYLVGPGMKSSDHRLVWVDLTVEEIDQTRTMFGYADTYRHPASNWYYVFWLEEGQWMWRWQDSQWYWLDGEDTWAWVNQWYWLDGEDTWAWVISHQFQRNLTWLYLDQPGAWYWTNRDFPDLNEYAE